MAYSPYGSFADLLNKAKAQSQLRGTSLSSKNVNQMAQGYFSDAAEAVNTDRAYNLAEAGQTLAEKGQAASESQFQQTYAQTADQFSKSLAQKQYEAQQEKEAAEKAQTLGLVGTGLTATGVGLYGADKLGYLGAKTSVPAAIGAGTAATALSGAEVLGGGSTLVAGGLDAAMATGGPAVVAEIGAEAAAAAAAEAGAGATLGSTVGSIIPYYAPAYIGSKIAQNNVERGTVVGDVVRNAADIITAPIDIPAKLISNAVGTVICTELHRQDLLSDFIYENDAKYREKITDSEYIGYRIIANPIVGLMQKSPMFTKVFAPLAIATATEMASQMNPDIRGNLLGRIILGMFIPLCGLVKKIHYKVMIFPRISFPKKLWRL